MGEKDTFPWTIPIIAVVVMGLFLFFNIGKDIGKDIGKSLERQAAIEAGVANWIIDPKTGERKFKYKEPQ